MFSVIDNQYQNNLIIYGKTTVLRLYRKGASMVFVVRSCDGLLEKGRL